MMEPIFIFLIVLLGVVVFFIGFLMWRVNRGTGLKDTGYYRGWQVSDGHYTNPSISNEFSFHLTDPQDHNWTNDIDHYRLTGKMWYRVHARPMFLQYAIKKKIRQRARKNKRRDRKKAIRIG